MPTPASRNRSVDTRWLTGGGIVLLGSLATAWHALGLLRDEPLARNLVSQGMWRHFVELFGGTPRLSDNHWQGDLNGTALLIIICAAGICAWLVGAAIIARCRGGAWRDALADWGKLGWAWWLLPLIWELLDLVFALAGWSRAQSLLWGMLPVWQSCQWSGWLTAGFALAHGRPSAAVQSPGQPAPLNLESPGVRWSWRRAVRATGRLAPWPVWLAMLVYFVAFGAMNWGLYESLLLPHGDSAMYEEHLWNLLHGKGFRSYLDQGRLFLGEHIQVVHVLLIPLYVLWPSQVLLELCQSVALAAGALPAYWLARRHGGSSFAAAALAIAYLLYVPMQFLDVAIDFKTFRPNSFEIPIFLAGFCCLERGRFGWLALWLALALSCQEDAAAIIAPLGVWLVCRAGTIARDTGTDPRRLRLAGAALALFGVLYVIFAVKVALPWFRGGADVHFAKYYSDLGDSSGSIVATVFRHPERVLARLFRVDSVAFGLTLLAGLGFLPLLSPGRLAVALPLFGVLCLSDLTNSPRHHFHAPLVPVLVWSAAAGLANVAPVFNCCQLLVRRLTGRDEPGDEKSRLSPRQFAASGKTLPVEPALQDARGQLATPRKRQLVETAALWGALCAAMTGTFLGLSPGSLGFWDPNSGAYWKSMYVPGERAEKFAVVLQEVPATARVASTDFVHPRFTHHDRSYDYSDYRPDVPDDADFIVIDAAHPYSRIHRPEDVKELRDQPDVWELLPDRTNGHFIVLRRRRGQ